MLLVALRGSHFLSRIMSESSQLRHETIVDAKERALSKMSKDWCWIDARWIQGH
jgi:hypothetical protein